VPRRANVRPDEPGRQKILDAGRAVFGRQGYDATSIAEVGAEAQIAKSVLYHYFGSKAGLYRAILEEDGAALLEAVGAAVPPVGAEGLRLRPGIDAFLRFLSEHPDTWRLMTRDPPADPELRGFHERIDAAIGESLREVLATPTKVEAKPDLVDLVALAVRTYASWWREHPDVPRSAVVDAIADLAAAGARRIPPARTPVAEG
jgi:AcrR family transcriptional regulator